jgi:protein-S-isoprenylcysteine O-methyltransferase Ste14
VSRGLIALVLEVVFFTIAFGLLVPNWWSLAALVVLVVGLELQVRLVEEPHLSRTHGAMYSQYRSTTGRFVPGFGTT